MAGRWMRFMVNKGMLRGICASKRFVTLSVFRVQDHRVVSLD